MASGHYHGDHSGNAALVTVAEDIRTVREHLGWQLRATRVLADLLTIAIRDTLARIGWTVGSGGTKVARCCHRRTTAERRREFQAWCTAVGATPQPEITSFDGNGALRVIATRYDGLVGVVVLADVYLDDDTKVDQ